MKVKLLSGSIGGVVAGMLFGMMMQMMNAPTPDGKEMPMMAMVAMVVGSSSIVAGWIYHLFNSMVIGAIFGVVLGNRVASFVSGVGLGALYGMVWWILGALILMPVLLGMSPFAPLMMPPMRMVAMGSLMGHLIFGSVLGGVFSILRSRVHSYCELPGEQ
ncbi:MAG: hypothetical protein IPM50_06335 [Acidobacteriota bacterium]|nr:MAG: hypothetical protein IPM50_06335 [Acidobacteriota bacterium]